MGFCREKAPVPRFYPKYNFFNYPNECFECEICLKQFGQRNVYDSGEHGFLRKYQLVNCNDYYARMESGKRVIKRKIKEIESENFYMKKKRKRRSDENDNLSGTKKSCVVYDPKALIECENSCPETPKQSESPKSVKEIPSKKPLPDTAKPQENTPEIIIID